MLPTFDFLVKIDKIYVTFQHFGEMSGTLTTKQMRARVEKVDVFGWNKSSGVGFQAFVMKMVV